MKTIIIKEIEESYGGEYFVEIQKPYPTGFPDERHHCESLEDLLDLIKESLELK